MTTLQIFKGSLFGIDFNFDNIAFHVGSWPIYWYGIMIASGFLLALIYGFANAKRLGVDPDRLTDIILVTTPIAVICARVYYILFDADRPLSYYFSSISKFLGIEGGSGVSGLGIYGGVIGAALCAVLMCRIRKQKIGNVLDVASIGFLIGQGIGRWGNFFNQEAFGTNTTMPWGMLSNGTENYLYNNQHHINARLGITIDPSAAVHPCFLYESIWCLVGVLLLHLISRKRKFSGQVALCYGAWYGIGRFIIEGFRTDSLYLGIFRVSQIVSLVGVVICGGIIVVLWRKSRIEKTITKEKAAYVDLFSEVENNVVRVDNANADETPSEIESDTETQTQNDTEIETDNSTETETETENDTENKNKNGADNGDLQ